MLRDNARLHMTAAAAFSNLPASGGSLLLLSLADIVPSFRATSLIGLKRSLSAFEGQMGWLFCREIVSCCLVGVGVTTADGTISIMMGFGFSAGGGVKGRRLVWIVGIPSGTFAPCCCSVIGMLRTGGSGLGGEGFVLVVVRAVFNSTPALRSAARKHLLEDSMIRWSSLVGVFALRKRSPKRATPRLFKAITIERSCSVDIFGYSVVILQAAK